jgi:uncharacterized protein
MAKWDNISSSGLVDDRRGLGSVVAGGVGVGGVVVYLLISYLTGSQVNVNDLINQLESTRTDQSQPTDTSQFASQDSYEVFASRVLGSNNELWQQEFGKLGRTYTPPKLVLFRSATQSGCGTATSDVGPHYCPLDQTIYLDETFFDQMETYLGATGGDVAEAYVISHEVGHHVQNLLGTIDQAPDNQQGAINIELQSDCYAGMWAHSIKDIDVIEPGEIQEAMDAAATVGDDNIQSKVNGQVDPETWTHGSSQERMKWFNTGYELGSFAQCNTFR